MAVRNFLLRLNLDVHNSETVQFQAKEKLQLHIMITSKSTCRILLEFKNYFLSFF